MSNLEHEEEQPSMIPPLLMSEEQWEEILRNMEVSAEESLHPAVAEARVAVARMAQEGAQQGRGFITTLWLLASPCFGVATLATLLKGDLGWALLNAFFLLTSGRLYKITEQNEQMHAAMGLHGANTKWVGALAEALSWPAPRARKIAAYLLATLLPRMTQEDWSLLSFDQRQILYSRLVPRLIDSNPDLTLALIAGLQNLKETEALPAIERLTEMRGWTATRRKIRLAAKICHAALEKQQMEEAARLSLEALEEAGETAQTQSGATANSQESVPPELESLINSIREQRDKAMQPGMRLPFLIGSWCFIVPYTATQAYINFSQDARAAGAIWLLFAAIGSQLHRITLLPGRSEEMKQLAQYNSVKGVGFLSEVLEWPDPSAQLAAGDALTRLLPRMKSSETTLLNERQRGCLYRRLKLSNARRDAPLIMAILKALEQVGDLAAVGYVKKLSESRPVTPAQKRIVEAAQDALPYLQRRADMNEGSQYLLRASHAADYAPEQLLRPSSEQATPPELLLRPSEPREK